MVSVAARPAAVRSAVPAATGTAVALAGVGFVLVGLWGRREVRRTLAQERIVSGGNAGAVVATANGARSMAEFIRRNTIEATGGRTYAQVDPYIDAEGNPTSEASRAAKDGRTGAPAENPDHALWIQSTTLQAALMQAYLAFRLSELTIGLGVSLALTGLGAVATAQQASR